MTRMSFKVVLREVESQRWAATNDGEWPEEDQRALNTAVRQSVKEYIQGRLVNDPLLRALGSEVIVE